MLTLTLYDLGDVYQPKCHEFVVAVNGKVIEHGYVSNRERALGWRALVRQVVDRPEPMGKTSITWDDDARISRDGP